MCKKILFILCLVLCIALNGCQTEGALQPSDGGNTQTKISNEMLDTIDNLNKLGIYDCYVGYKSDSLAAWVDIPSEIDFVR